MEIIDFVLHIDKHLEAFISSYGTLVYLLLFLIVFCETGLVVTPFLPGDSLLFAAGALAANPINNLNVGIIIVILIIAALLGITRTILLENSWRKKEKGQNYLAYLPFVKTTWIRPIHSMRKMVHELLSLLALCLS